MADVLTLLERDVIATILRPDHPVMNALRRQFERCHVASRQMTGVGFLTELDTDVERAPVRPGRLCVGDVTVTIDGLERGAGFLLFVEDGVLDTLEGFTYDEPWPDVIGRYEVTAGGISHSGGSKTDVEQVDEAWSPSDDIPAR